MIGAITAGLYAGGVPPVTNSYESIATVTVGSGGSATVSFTSIPSTFTHLQVRILWKPNSGTNLVGNFNSDTGSNYKAHELYGDGSSASSFVPSVSPNGIALGYNGGSTQFGTTILDILDYANVNKNTTTRSLFGDDRNGSGEVSLDSGLWMNTAAVTRIDFKLQNSGNIQEYSSFALYGIKG